MTASHLHTGASGGVSPLRDNAEVSGHGPPIDHQRRYDRGIRVWGSHGQQALEQARICLLNASATGSEALKNLVLGGINSYTIVDGSCVGAADVGNNYLVNVSALGCSRAACVADYLKELNETVSGSYVEEDVTVLIRSNPDFFNSFDLIIASQLKEPDALALDELCRARQIKLLLARSYGLIGYLRNCVAEHVIIESRPDNEVPDLRVADPWPELGGAAADVDLASLSETDHSHVPFGILLVKAASEWKNHHDGQLPKGSKECRAFKDLLRSWQRSIDGCPIPEENFAEAVNNAHLVWAPPVIASETRSILGDESVSMLNSSSSDFWVLVAALKRFLEAEGRGSLPLEGSLPDMHASTQRYLELQRLYRDKAEADAAAVENHVKTLLKTVGRETTAIASADIRKFCKHARHLHVVRTRSLKNMLNSASHNSAEALRTSLAGEGGANTALHLLLRAADRFYAQYQRFPGTFSGELEEDAAVLKTLVGGILHEAGAAGAASTVSDDLAWEVARCGAGELHVVASVVGAMASQEAIKLLTSQFIPLKGTLIYSAIHCTTALLPE